MGLLSLGQREGVEALLDLLDPSAVIDDQRRPHGVVGESQIKPMDTELWHAVLLPTVASWGGAGCPRLGLRSLFLGAPGLAEHRVKFTLELPLTSAPRWPCFCSTAGKGQVHVEADGLRRSLLQQQLPLPFLSSRAPCLWFYPPPWPVSKL